MKTTRKRFKVRGCGRFPADMLRYDCCWPSTSADATLIDELAERHLLADREDRVELRLRIEAKGIVLESDSVHAPTVGRWESFGWGVEVLR